MFEEQDIRLENSLFYFEDSEHGEIITTSTEKDRWFYGVPTDRKCVREIIEQTPGMTIPQEWIEYLNDDSLESVIREKIHMLNIPFEDFERWIELCYMVGLNPLPKCREIFGTGIEVKYVPEDVPKTWSLPPDIDEGEPEVYISERGIELFAGKISA